ncbi:BLOC-1-related complex subunit 6 isoform X1 [Acipenser oxyrinchus oxyrinchus]|uniref:BLOC-1-related complex subunit 6 isoform X1 n=1 Tax=Acipenser oxyrinchus oxyrinchus TaxID=40147 RepID=A0AAD8D079_ACIOX|nr:BLOC-1-related complex subunit 6 isoform X1 [Acipenser oxyrinchus oxyrinchus]
MSFSPASGTEANGLDGAAAGSVCRSREGGDPAGSELACRGCDGEQSPHVLSPSLSQERGKASRSVLAFASGDTDPGSQDSLLASQNRESVACEGGGSVSTVGLKSDMLSSVTDRRNKDCRPEGRRVGEPAERETISASRCLSMLTEPHQSVVEEWSSEDEEKSLEREEEEEEECGETDDTPELSAASTPPDILADDKEETGLCNERRGSWEAEGFREGESRQAPRSPEGSPSPTQKNNRVNPFNQVPGPSPPEAPSLPTCPQHVMAQVYVCSAPAGGAALPWGDRERIVGRLQDSKSLDGISQVCGGARCRERQPEGRRATISSALELEGTVSHDGDLTHFVANNLQQKIKMSSRQSLDSDSSVRSRGSQRKLVDIPPIDPAVLQDLERQTQDVAQSVELMMRSLSGTVQNMTALSVGCIQTYRDSVDSLGESVDMSIKGMYTLMARCEELDRSMHPIHSLAKQIHDIKRTLEMLETVCK